MPITNNKDIIRKNLGNKGLYLNKYSVTKLTMNFIVIIREYRQPFRYPINTFDSESNNEAK